MPSPSSLFDLRRRVLRGQTVSSELVSAPVLRSWQRCAEAGLDMERIPTCEPLTSSELSDWTDRHEGLMRQCRPELGVMGAEAKRSSSVVILTSPDGMILEAVGNPEFAGRAAQVSLRPGVSWDEPVHGTNAIGAAMVERNTVTVHGPEHYFMRQSILSCTASPILNPTGQTIGILDLSGHARTFPVHASGLVRLAVDQIEHRQFQAGFAGHEILRFHCDHALVGTVREGILVFAEDRLVAANRHGLRLLGWDWKDLENRSLTEFVDPRRLEGGKGMFLTRAGMECWGTMARSRKPGSRIFAAPSRRFSSTRPTAVPDPIFDASTERSLTRAVRLLDGGIPVLVEGETGTGKEVFAREVHARCARRSQPFVAVNCAALPESLIESELFGYAPGAFTGARAQGSPGLLREAHGGVLFLDEIGDMPLALQARLLRVLQEREVRPLGGGKPVPVDFALICATHRSLAERMETGEFRQDLYFRIAQYSFELPPVRRLESFPETVAHLWRALQEANKKVRLNRAAQERLLEHSWPGNFRELVSTLRALFVLAEDGETVDRADLPASLQRASHALPRKMAASAAASVTLDDLTLQSIETALETHNGNVSRAARQLGIDRSTLYRRLRRARSGEN